MTKNYLFEVEKIWVKMLRPDQDVESLQVLCEKCTDYYLQVGGVAPNADEAADLFVDLPPNKSTDDKVLLGIYNEENLMIGVIDMMKNFPEDGIWYVGQMMIDPAYRGQGIGEKVFQAYEKWVTSQGIHRIRLSVVEQNPKGFNFWNKVGFEVIKEIPNRQFGEKETTVKVMERQLV